MTARFCALCKRTLLDGRWRAYCTPCMPVAQIVSGSVSEAVQHYIPNADRDLLVRCLDLERAKPQARTTIITAIQRRLRKLTGGRA